jgi:flavin-dependent dehydrogenase
VPRLQLHSPGLKSIKEVSFNMITTDRRRLGQTLIDQAVDAGASVYYNHEGERLLYRETGETGPGGVEVFGVVVKDLGTGLDKELQADLVVESSGFSSVLRTSLPQFTGLAYNFPGTDFALVHREVRAYEPDETGSDAVPDYYRYGFHTGYQWSHIHNEKSIDVGAGVRNDPTNPDPRDLIEEFISHHPSIKKERLRGGRSLCIVGRPLDNFVAAGFLVIGDAASMSVPTTGCGAGSAILAALWAAEVVTEAIEKRRNDLELLWAFNVKFYSTDQRGASFAALSCLRTMLQALTHDELDFLFIHDLLDAGTLQDAVNGKFRPPGLKKKLKALTGGVQNIRLLLKLNRAVSSATNVYKHYLNYPDQWDPQVFRSWKEKADRLHSA